jgi:hypothetical protein
MRYEDRSPGVRVVRGVGELATDPELWTVDLRDGRQITVMAHGYHVEPGEVVFSVLFGGRPPVEVDTLRLPLDLLPEGFS